MSDHTQEPSDRETGRMNAEQVHRLLTLSTIDDIQQFLSDVACDSGKWKWVPLGGRENNSGSINLAMDPGQALVERITNSMDAHIELEFELAGRPTGLDSPREAVQRLWNLESSRLTRESPSVARFIDEMAPRISVRVVGSMGRRQSSVMIRDSGIGQHPDDLPTTILGLQESNKADRRYLMGAFGQGGSSTFAYCPYSLVISRRHPLCLGSSKSDVIGWTVVRQFDEDAWKTFRYEYLVAHTGLIPRISPEVLDTLGTRFDNGTRIVHFAYDLGRINASWSRVGFRFFDNLLFDPVLPYRIEDHRVSPRFNRNLHGGRNRLEQVSIDRRPEAQTHEPDLSRWGAEGRVNIRYWVFRPGIVEGDDSESGASVRLGSYLDYDNSPLTIIFTLNGQRHHARGKSLVRDARLGALADYLLVHVDCDDLSLRLKKEIFTATRAGAMIGERREDLLINAVREALGDSWLKQKLEEILRRRETALATESTRRVNQMLNRLITVYRQGSSAGGRRGSQEGSGRDGRKRQTHDPPRSLEFADHRRLDLLAGEHKVVHLITDGPDNILSRQHRPGNLVFAIEGDNIARFAVDKDDMRNGRIPVRILVSSTATNGQGGRIIASLEVPPITLLTSMREIRVVPPPLPYVGTDPPTIFEFAKKTALTVEVGRRSVAEIHTNARNDLITRAVHPSHISGSSNVPGMFISVRGPRDGLAQLEINVSPSAQVGAEGGVTAKLALHDGTVFETSRAVSVIASKQHSVSTGSQPASLPAYQLKRVWQRLPEGNTDDITWDDVNNYSATRVGHYEPNGDELWLYVNMDETQFRAERIHWGRRFGESTSGRLTDRYVAYIAFHLFQLYDSAERAVSSVAQCAGDGNGNAEAGNQSPTYDPESVPVSEELRRVTATLIQTLRSEAELARLQDSGGETEDRLVPPPSSLA